MATPFRQAMLPLAPLQLVAQHVERKCAARVGLYGVFGFAADDAIALLDRHADLAIDAEEGLFGAGLDVQLDLRLVGDDQRAMRQRLGQWA